MRFAVFDRHIAAHGADLRELERTPSAKIFAPVLWLKRVSKYLSQIFIASHGP
jgi:hypothetical protein